MFTHVVVGSNDLARSKKFYDALFGAIGGNPGMEGFINLMHPPRALDLAEIHIAGNDRVLALQGNGIEDRRIAVAVDHEAADGAGDQRRIEFACHRTGNAEGTGIPGDMAL